MEIMQAPTYPTLQRPNGDEQHVYRLFPLLQFIAYLVHISNQTHVLANEYELALSIQGLAFLDDTVASFLGATEDVQPRTCSVFGELTNSCFTNAIGAANEYGDQTGRQ